MVQPTGYVQRANGRPEPGARVFVREIPATEEKTDWAGIVSSVAAVLTSALAIILVAQRL